MSKYSIANELVAAAAEKASAEGLDEVDVQEATLVMLVQALKASKGPRDIRGILQYEIDSLGSGGVYEIARGGGHS